MSDTTLFDILRAFQMRDTSDDAEIRALTDRDITRAIERHHAHRKPSIGLSGTKTAIF